MTLPLSDQYNLFYHDKRVPVIVASDRIDFLYLGDTAVFKRLFI